MRSLEESSFFIIGGANVIKQISVLSNCNMLDALFKKLKSFSLLDKKLAPYHRNMEQELRKSSKVESSYHNGASNIG